MQEIDAKHVMTLKKNEIYIKKTNEHIVRYSAQKINLNFMIF